MRVRRTGRRRVQIERGSSDCLVVHGTGNQDLAEPELLADPQGLSQHLRGVAAASMAGHDVVADVAAFVPQGRGQRTTTRYRDTPIARERCGGARHEAGEIGRRLLEPIGGQPFLDRGLGLTSQLGGPDPGGWRNEVRHAMSMTAASRGVEDAVQVAGILLPAGTQPRLPQGVGISSPHRSPSRTGPWISGLSASPFGTPHEGPMLRKRLVDHE
jgi:hypothetical protein